MTEKVGQLSVDDILEKDFKTGLRGYSPDEVDQFLDIVIKDYEAFNNEIIRLQEELREVRQSLNSQKSERERRPKTVQGQTNYDILKRLSNLEKHVFGSRLSE